MSKQIQIPQITKHETNDQGGGLKVSNLVKSSITYDRFKLLPGNRDMTPGHIKRLMRAIQEHPEILEAQPILVNEKMQIIDGQHRFEAAKGLGLPIYYVVVPGIGIEVARSLNVMQRKWEPIDFARSYAASGNENYRIYIKIREQYNLPHNIVMSALNGGGYEW